MVNYMLKISKYELKCNADLKIVHFSDIHYEKNFRLKKFKQIISKIKELKPDYICITGDIVDNLEITKSEKMQKLADFLEELTKLSKVIISLGNHDTRDYKKLKDNKWYNDLNKNIILLNNSSYEDENIYFYGLTMPGNYYYGENKKEQELFGAFKNIKINSNKYSILLFHSPINLKKERIIKINKFNLILTGHTHNGLTPHFIPGNFGLVAPYHKLFLKNARNSFEIEKSKVIISGGITKISKKIIGILDLLFASDIVYICLKKNNKKV